MSTDDPQPLRRSLDRLLGHLHAPDVDAVDTIFHKWATIVGEGVAAHSRPTAIDGNQLVVTVDDAAWGSELRWLESELLARIAEHTGSTRITQLTVRVASRGDGAEGW